MTTPRPDDDDTVRLAAIPTIRKLYDSSELKSPPADKIRHNVEASLLDKISLYQGDITKLEVDAIVNAANKSLLGGGGVDGAIHQAAGPHLLEECRTLNGCNTGDAKITRGYGLPSRHVVHTVGPIYSPLEAEEKAQQLTSCYRTSLEIAVENNARHIAFPSISTGVYSYPIEDATRIALEEVRRFCDSEIGSKLERVIFVVWSNKDRSVYESLIPQYFPPVAAEQQQKDTTTTDPDLGNGESAPTPTEQEMRLFFNIFIAAFSSIGAFLFGYDSGIIASVITMERYLARFGNDPSIRGAVVSTFNGGCFFGAMGAGWANDKFGRKRTIPIGCLFAIWGCSMQAGASNVATLLIGRIIGGLAIGVLSMTVPLYNTEIAPPKIRGFLVGLTQQMIGFGFIVANWVGYGSQYINSDTSWRLPLGLQIAPAGLLFVGIQFLPFSPRWLLEVGRDEEAKKVVYQLHGEANKETAEEEYRQMHDTIKAEASIRSRRISDLWATRPMLRRTFVAVGVQVFCQFTGINVINYFGPQMYESLGVTGDKALLVQGIYGAVGPIANLFFITLILDRVGRKKPLMFGAASFVATFSILAAIVATNPPGDPNSSAAAQRAGIAMIFLTSIFFSVSFGPVSWVLASEVFPTNTRSIGTSVVTCANWAFNTLIGQVSPLAMTNVKWKFYMLFVSLNLVDFIIIALFFPETKGKTLEEMNAVFGDEIDTTRVSAEKSSSDEKGSIYAAP
ncbi:High-affinity glucose transporter [Hypsizygus marmoreus]|uniref:High-affinity glucose transporter n=1 Tax=Hypsizygus marmoreus TaxID=39966 RepID=A0A369K4C1_HYPMA|nr:High-affinity glucose transporter [Hypsizygus marmoreus]